MTHRRHSTTDSVPISRSILEDLHQFLLALTDQPNAIRAAERALDCGDFFAHVLSQVAAAARTTATAPATPARRGAARQLSDRWLIEWRDAGDHRDRDVCEVAESAELAVAIVRRLLSRQAWIDGAQLRNPGRRRQRAALPILGQRLWASASEALAILRDVRGGIVQQTEAGTLRVTRLRDSARVVNGTVLYPVSRRGEVRWVSVPEREQFCDVCGAELERGRCPGFSAHPAASPASAREPRLGYYHLSRAWYAQAATQRGPNAPVDEIMFGRYFGDGSGTWEAGMRWYILRDGREPAARLEVFDDAFRALAELPGLFTELASVQAGTMGPVDFATMLQRHGFRDMTPERPPSSGMSGGEGAD